MNKTYQELCDEIRNLRQELEMATEYAADRHNLIEMIAESLGVDKEPRQSFTDRLLEAADAAGESQSIPPIMIAARAVAVAHGLNY